VKRRAAGPFDSLLAIDSGSPGCAFAVAEGGVLSYVGEDDGRPNRVLYDGARPFFDRVVVEIPTIRGASTPNAEDLIVIATVGVRLAERFAKDPARITEYRPSEWKGNTPKPAHHRRMWDSLTDSERTLLGGAKTLAAIDAACLRGARDRWRKPGSTYYRAREFPTVNGVKISHDILDAAALALYALGRIRRG